MRPLSADGVAREVVARGSGTGPGRTTVVRLGWVAADPLAVTVHLTAHPEHPALARGSWVILRDFLRYGLEEPTGDGDVRIRPSGDDVVLVLTRAGRSSEVYLARAVVRGFLDDCEAVVPTGEEADETALDALIEHLLER